ncbi:MAG: hypothetical protein J2P23_02990 [Microlunatus sp.]|nr:hypothetical protein [Microlunatus sp.]
MTGGRPGRRRRTTNRASIPTASKSPNKVEVLYLDAERALPVEKGSYRWRGELRLWDNEALMGWYRSTDGAVRSRGTMYLALHQQGTFAWGRWVGMSYDGEVITGWGVLARTEREADAVAQNLVDLGKPLP